MIKGAYLDPPGTCSLATIVTGNVWQHGYPRDDGGCRFTASSLARGINTPGTAGVRDGQFQIQLHVYLNRRSENETQ